jgi:hypothetical protein
MGNRFPSLMSAIRRQLPFFAFLAESMLFRELLKWHASRMLRLA